MHLPTTPAWDAKRNTVLQVTPVVFTPRGYWQIAGYTEVHTWLTFCPSNEEQPTLSTNTQTDNGKGGHA